MKTLLGKAGKFKLVVLFTLCAVILGCAVLLCCTLLNKESDIQTAEETTTTIERPDNIGQTTATSIPCPQFKSVSGGGGILTQTSTIVVVLWTGSPITADFSINYNPYYMTTSASGNTPVVSGTNPGQYTLTFTVNTGYAWSGTSSTKYTCYLEIVKRVPVPSFTSGTAGVVTGSGQSATAPYTGSSLTAIFDTNYDSSIMTSTGGVTGGAPVLGRTEIGSSTLTIKFIDNSHYQWEDTRTSETRTCTFTVTKGNYDMSGAKWDYTSAFTYDGSSHSVSVTGLPSGVTVSSYSGTRSATNAGTYTAGVTLSYDSAHYNAPSIGNLTWTINKYNIANASITLDTSTYTYDGNAKTPTPTLKMGSTVISSSYYTIARTNNTNVGTGTVTVTANANSANFTGTKSINFTINKASQTAPTITGSASVVYGSAITLSSSGSQTGNYTWSVSSTTGGATATLSSTSGSSVTLTGTKAGGTVTVTVYGNSGDNYNQSSNTTKTITISARSIVAYASWSISPVTYNGYAHSPKPAITDSTNLVKTALVEDTDFTYSYENNTNAGTASITITGKGNYTGSKTGLFTINPQALTDADVSAISNYTYANVAIKPEPTVAIGSNSTRKNLAKDRDFTFGYTDNVNAGTATLTITFKGNYSGEITRNFTIEARDISNVSFGTINNQPYTGSDVRPQPAITDTGLTPTKVLTENVDFAFDYTDNVNVGTATIKIIGAGNYKGEKQTTFTIIKGTYDMSGVAWNYTGAFPYDGTTKTVTVTGLPTGLSVNAYTGNSAINVGNYTASVTFNYDATNYNEPTLADLAWQITKASYDMTGVTWNYTTPFTYDGTLKTVSLVGTLPDGVTIDAYTGNTATTVGTYIATVTFTYDATNYTAPIVPTLTWEISKATYDMTGVSWDYTTPFIYDGTQKTVTVVGTFPDGVTVKAYLNNAKTNADSYTASVTFNYDTTNYNEPTLADLSWVINKANYDMTGVEWNYTTPFTYDGNQKTVTVTGTLPNGVTVNAYTGNTGTTVDNYTATVTFNYDTVNYNMPTLADLAWEIIKADYDMTNAEWDYTTPFEYDGTLKTVSVTGLPTGVTVDAYTGNTGTDVGNYTATVTFTYDTANYNTPTLADLAWEIIKATPNVDLNDVTVEYDGNTHYLTITGTLPADVTVEYYVTGLNTKFDGAKDVKYSGGAVVGYQVTAKFTSTTGNYEVPADISAVLTITPKTIPDGAVSGIDATYVYTGVAQTPAPTVKLALTNGGTDVTLVLDHDYTVKYSDSNPNAGTKVKVEIEGKGNYQGTIERSFEITKKTLSINWIGKNTNFVYNGTAQGITATLDGIVASDTGVVVPTIVYTGRGATEAPENNAMPTDAGYYTVSVSLDDTFTNYVSFGVLTEDFRIDQAELIVTAEFDGYDPATDTLYMGGTLPNLTILSATFNGNTIAGQWSWVDESLHEKVQDDYTWQYVPTSETDKRNFKTFTAVITLNAERAPIVRIEAVLNPDAPAFYVTTSFDTIKNYVTVTGYFASPVNGETQTEIKGYSLTSDKFTDYPDTPNVYVLTVSYNGLDCELEVEYFGLGILGITVTAKDPNTGIKTEYKGYDVFDRTSIEVTAERNDGYKWVLKDDEYTIEYVSKKDFLTVGETYVTIIYENRKEEISVDVKQADFDLTGISFKDDSVEYDGSLHTVSINGTFLKGTIEYKYYDENGVEISDGLVNAGEYEVKAIFTFTDATDKKNYKPVTLTKSFVIEKAEYDVSFKNVTTDFNGETLKELVKIEGLPEGDEVAVSYSITYKPYGSTTATTISSLDDIKNAGTYEITVSFKVDSNHKAITAKKSTFTVNRIAPQINPTVGGNFTEGIQLSKLFLVAGDGEIDGTYQWKDVSYELQAGVNRCYYTFVPEDTVNYKEVTSYIDLTAVSAGGLQPTPSGTVATNIPDWATYILVGFVILVLIVALIALIIALKGRSNADMDSDGFYDEVTEEDLAL
ncbi:MAG: hypothetical protein HDQ88_11405 [Clostridia bacterium]|nr:hypothetical protein [Clostridia bacterium]